jgi:hypothetical protein
MNSRAIPSKLKLIKFKESPHKAMESLAYIYIAQAYEQATESEELVPLQRLELLQSLSEDACSSLTTKVLYNSRQS